MGGDHEARHRAELPVPGTILFTNAGSKILSMVAAGGPLQELTVYSGGNPTTLPPSVEALALRNHRFLFSSSNLGTETQITITDLISNTINPLGTSPFDPDIHTVVDFAFVVNALYAAAFVPQPGSPVPCPSLDGRVVLIDQATGDGTVITGGPPLCLPCDIVELGGDLYIPDPVYSCRLLHRSQQQPDAARSRQRGYRRAKRDHAVWQLHSPSDRLALLALGYVRRRRVLP